MGTILALIGGALIGQIGTVVTHLLATRRDRHQAAFTEEAAVRQWERDEKSKEAHREHDLRMLQAGQRQKQDEEARAACEALIAVAQRAVLLDGTPPTYDEVNDAWAKVRGRLDMSGPSYGPARRLTDMTLSRIQYGKRDADGGLSGRELEWETTVRLDEAIAELTDAMRGSPNT